MHASTSVVVGDRVGAAGGGDVHLNHDQVRLRAVVQLEALDVLVVDADGVLLAGVSSQCGQAERWEKRVFDRPKERTGGFRERRQNQLDAQWPGHKANLGG